MTAHALVIGETQSGKTYWSNQLHRQSPGASIFWNTNEVPGVWGTQCRAPGALLGVLARDSKVNYVPPQDAEEANAQLAQTVALLFKYGRGNNGSPPWVQILVDEAQVYSRETSVGGRPDPVRVVATRGLGAYGVRLVAITQYPPALNTTTRTNCKDLIVFSPGREGLQFLQNRGFAQDVPAIAQWTRNRHHFVSYHDGQGPRLHTPLRG